MRNQFKKNKKEKEMHYLIDMNLPDFKVPTVLSHRQPKQEEQEKYRALLNEWRSKTATMDEKQKEEAELTKPVPPQTVIIPNAAVCHDILKTALTMAVPEGNPDTLRRLQKIHKAIEEGLSNKGQLILSQEDHRFLQSKYAKADKWNTQSDVCNTVIAVQDAISRAVAVIEK